MKIALDIPKTMYEALRSHLFGDHSTLEEAAFLFAYGEANGNALTFKCTDWHAVPPEGFAHRTSFYLELTVEMQARVIKQAHDLRASLIEVHSHTGPWPAQFSPSDFEGFEEFVPHLLWRLKGKPYLAVVMTHRDVDALVWLTKSDPPRGVEGLVVGGRTIVPTNLSLGKMKNGYGS